MRRSPPLCTPIGPPPNAPAAASWRRGSRQPSSEQPRPGAAPALDAHGEAVLLALACANPPQGRAAWTMQLLADELVERGVIGTISDETVRRTRKKTTAAKLAGGGHTSCSAVGKSPS
jgi:hypothetical protein